ncbi:MAG: DUF3298 domain-containing protein [Bacteroidales bacterium]|jgi:hypothetical protein
MKKTIFAAVLYIAICLGTNLGTAQSMIPKKCYLHLIGAINKDFPIEMNLIKINDTLYGNYSFLYPGKSISRNDEAGNSIAIYGKMNSIDAFTIKENIPNQGGLFSGKFISRQELSGTYENSKGNKVSFDVTEKYPDGSVSMDVHYQKAFTPLVKKPGSPVANIQLLLLVPSESANPLISDTLIHLMLVKFSDKPVRMSLPDKVLEGMKQVYFENYLSTNEAIYKESMASSFNWQSLKFMNILMNGAHILSFYIDHYAFTGGAHGLMTRQHTVVNLWNGKEVELKDIFKENTEKQISQIIGEKIHMKLHLPTTQSLSDAGFFKDTIKPADNFYITYEGIGFYYNQYDIAPYASGTFDIFIPFSELNEVLNLGGIIRKLVRK